MVKGLVLFPLMTKEQPDEIVGPCVDRLTFVPDDRIFRQLVDLSGQMSSQGALITEKTSVTVYWLPESSHVELLLVDQGLKHCTQDTNGRQLTFIRAHEFWRLRFPEDTDDKNKAIVALVAAMPESTVIILYWT
jgi:hypothetical protein